MLSVLHATKRLSLATAEVLLSKSAEFKHIVCVRISRLTYPDADIEVSFGDAAYDELVRQEMKALEDGLIRKLAVESLDYTVIACAFSVRLVSPKDVERRLQENERTFEERPNETDFSPRQREWLLKELARLEFQTRSAMLLAFFNRSGAMEECIQIVQRSEVERAEAFEFMLSIAYGLQERDWLPRVRRLGKTLPSLEQVALQLSRKPDVNSISVMFAMKLFPRLHDALCANITHRLDEFSLGRIGWMMRHAKDTGLRRNLANVIVRSGRSNSIVHEAKKVLR